MTTAMPALALLISAGFIADGLESLAARPIAPRRPRALRPRALARTPAAAPDPRVILARNAFDSTTGPLWPPPIPPPPELEPPEQREPLGPCEAQLRMAGVAYIGPAHGEPMALFSGPDVQRRGVRRVGGVVAGRTVIAIYPSAVLLRDPAGDECWLRMSSAHARELLTAERRARDVQLRKRAQLKAREKARERAAAVRAKKKRK